MLTNVPVVKQVTVEKRQSELLISGTDLCGCVGVWCVGVCEEIT